MLTLSPEAGDLFVQFCLAEPEAVKVDWIEGGVDEINGKRVLWLKARYGPGEHQVYFAHYSANSMDDAEAAEMTLRRGCRNFVWGRV